MDSSQPTGQAFDDRPQDAADALHALRAGNDRWRTDAPHRPRQTGDVRRDLAAGQRPFATVLGCVDSRVPAELVFDRGLGDLLVVRTAGQMIDDAVVASVQFGALQLGTPLVVVLGHSDCGAVKAAAQVHDGAAPPPGRLTRLVEWVTPALEDVAGVSTEQRAEAAATANVRRTADLLAADELLAPLIEDGRLRVVGARYELDTGQATFLT